MEIKKKNKSTFSAISINRITAERFREYSKTVSKSHTETLDTMIDFFEKANITPRSKVMISFIKFQLYMAGRLGYIIEILRDNERKLDRAVKVSHLGRKKVSIANHVLKIDSIEV